MPSRMPNWKMRANALVDGMPTTRLCRMPSFGSTCMMRTMRRIESAVWNAVGVERDGELVVRAPAGAEIEHVAGLEAGIVGAPPVGELEAALPISPASAAKRGSSVAAISG